MRCVSEDGVEWLSEWEWEWECEWRECEFEKAMVGLAG
jgi:hypothetical protein